MYLIFFNLAVLSAVVFYITRTIKKSFQYEVRQIAALLRNPKLPPGPLGLPWLGSIPTVTGTDGYTPFSRLAAAYGGMVYMKLGKTKVLVLREPEMIKEAYKMVAFSDRPKTSFKDDGLIGNKGIIQSVGNVWSEHRRLILTAFRQLGLKSASASITPQTTRIAELMQHDVQAYLDCVTRDIVDRPAGITAETLPVTNNRLERLTGRLAGSCVSSCVLGLPRSFADPEFGENVAVIEEGFHVGEKLAPFEVLPILKWVPGMWRKVEEKMRQNHCVTCRYFKGLIREKVTESSMAAEEGGDCQSPPDSLITIYRQEMTRRAEVMPACLDEQQPTILSEAQLMQTMTDLFCAATETVKYSLMWMMLYMAKYPEIQRKIQDEMDSVVGEDDRLVSWNDLSRLPYTEATILECLRLRPVLPFGHPRAVHDAGADFRGYQIPKDTVVLALIWDVHQDPRYWENPLQFQPTRFINAEGKTFRPDNFIPFGTGRRLCMGDQMAMMQLFTALTGLLTRYTIVPKTDAPVDLSWKILLSLLIPAAFQVDLLPRSCADQTVSRS